LLLILVLVVFGLYLYGYGSVCHRMSLAAASALCYTATAAMLTVEATLELASQELMQVDAFLASSAIYPR